MKKPQDENVPKPSNIAGEAWTELVAEKAPTNISKRNTTNIFSLIGTNGISTWPIWLFSL
jgi:hypothetical protein